MVGMTRALASLLLGSSCAGGHHPRGIGQVRPTGAGNPKVSEEAQNEHELRIYRRMSKDNPLWGVRIHGEC